MALSPPFPVGIGISESVALFVGKGKPSEQGRETTINAIEPRKHRWGWGEALIKYVSLHFANCNLRSDVSFFQREKRAAAVDFQATVGKTLE